MYRLLCRRIPHLDIITQNAMFNTVRLLAEANLNPPKIYSSSTLAPVNRSGVSHLLVKYSPNRTYAFSSDRFASDNPITSYHIWADRSKWYKRTDSFWWSVLCKKDSTAPKRVLRSYVARKVRNAIVDSLKKKGYKADGSRLVDDEVPPLSGTMQITPVNTVLTMKYADVVKETDVVIKTLSSSEDAEKIRKSLVWAGARMKNFNPRKGWYIGRGNGKVYGIRE
jgi:hypothetical protein